MSLAVIDGDIISYKVAAACERRSIIVTHKQSGRSKEWNTRTEFKDWLVINDKWQLEDFDIEDKQTPEPIEFCLTTVKQMVNNIHKMSGCGEVKLVVQGTGNFRDDLLLPTKYKSSRSANIKPLLLGGVKEYIVRKYKAELAHGWESDDVLSAYAYEGFRTKKKIVQCTPDKDAKMCSGWLLNWDKMTEPKFISGLGTLFLDAKGKLDGYGRKWLMYQASVGDSSDCYKPTELTKYKYGEKSALKDFGELQTDKECWERLATLYKTWYPEQFTYTAWNGEQVEADYLHMMQLYIDAAHMRRFKEDKLNVKEILGKLGVQYG